MIIFHNNKPIELNNQAEFDNFARNFRIIHAAGGIVRNEQEAILMIYRLDKWDFPKGKVEAGEQYAEAAIREVEEETGLKVTDVYQIGAYSKVDRDPRGRTISVAYLAIIEKPISVIGQDDAAKAEWWPINSLPHLAFDHDEIVSDAITLYHKILKL